MTTNYVMKVSSNGQVSIPAETRSRWHAESVLVVDMGNRIVLRPLPDEPVKGMVGKYRGRGPSTTVARRAGRHDDARIEARRTK